MRLLLFKENFIQMLPLLAEGTERTMRVGAKLELWNILVDLNNELRFGLMQS